MHRVSKSIQETHAYAAELAVIALAELGTRAEAMVIALEGELGAGKTTFVQGFAHALGVREIPKSPTFNLVKRYDIPGKNAVLWHLDCYRFSSHHDLRTIDAHAIFHDPRAIVLVEWADRVRDALPRGTMTIIFEHADPTTRHIHSIPTSS